VNELHAVLLTASHVTGIEFQRIDYRCVAAAELYLGSYVGTKEKEELGEIGEVTKVDQDYAPLATH